MFLWTVLRDFAGNRPDNETLYTAISIPTVPVR